MKKLILVVGLLNVLLSIASPGDTLTWRRAFAVSAGDTFDYKVTYESTIPGWLNFNYWYVREIIDSVYIAPTNDSIIIQKTVQTNVNTVDTKFITNLDSFVNLIGPTGCYLNITNIDSSKYNGRKISALHLSGLACGNDSTYGEGLGLTYCHYGSGDGDGHYMGTTTELVYYAKGTEVYGTAYYNLPTKIVNNTSLVEFSLSPNPASSYLTINISEEHTGSTFALTDLTGRVALQSEITNPKSEISIASMPSGIYLAVLTTPSGQQAVKKVVKE